MYDDEKMSLDDAVIHYGVAGMKWGKHRAKASGDDIHDARARLQVKANEYHKANKAAKKVSDPEQKAAAKAAVGKMKTDFLKDPDRVTASRLTKGEKALSLLIAGPFGAAAIASTSAQSRRIEKKQDDGKYDK